MMPKDALKHLQERHDKLNSSYRDTWGRWTIDDFVALSVLLPLMDPAVERDGVEQARMIAEREAKA